MEYLDEKPMIHRGKKFCPELDWKKVRGNIKDHGMRNSNTMAIAPTATISYIQGCSPCIEPDFSVFFVYENKSGNLTIINEWFVKKCKEIGIWSPSLVEAIKAVDGDLSQISDEVIPREIKEQYKTAFDHDQFKLIEGAAARQKWIDMGQSLNLFNDNTSLKYLNDLYMFARAKGLKSTYYLRNKSASKIEKSTTDSSNNSDSNSGGSDDSGAAPKACSILDPTCESCQ